jgi:gliding motility-associated-like protein
LRQEKHWPAILILCVCSRNLKRLCRKRLYLPDTIKHLSHFLLYAKPDNYDFKIFDRWYHLIFSTNDINGSWDGNYNGAPAPLDGYIYVIKYKGKDDNDYTQTGTIMLLK